MITAIESRAKTEVAQGIQREKALAKIAEDTHLQKMFESIQYTIETATSFGFYNTHMYLNQTDSEKIEPILKALGYEVNVHTGTGYWFNVNISWK